ncbi:MAG: hypothetical protein F4W89_07155 [Acidobacteria bacterium]|nr:hypothetical protein [Acidobacteriota bacterium]
MAPFSTLRRPARVFATVYAAITVVLSVLLLALEAGLAERAGLRRLVFPGVEFAGTPVLDDISSDVALDFLEDDPTLPRRFFSARWQGFLYLPEPAVLELYGAGDDRLEVWIDGDLVIRRTPPADMHTQVRDVALAAGVHDVRAEYVQHGGAYLLRLESALGDGRPRSLSQHRLFFQPPDDRGIQLVQRAGLLRDAVSVLWLGPVAFGLVLVARSIAARYRGRRWCLQWSGARLLRTASVVALGAVSLSALIARLPGWNPESLWADDVIFGSLIRSQDLYSLVMTPTNYAPGLFVLWRGFYEIFPDPEWSLQILPFASGIAAIPVMACLGWRLTGDATLGVLAGAMAAVNPLLAFYTVAVHQYSFEFLVTALFLVAAVGLHTPGAGIDPRRFRRIALWGGVAAFFAAPSLFVTFPIVHLGALVAVCNWKLRRLAARKVLLWSAVYDGILLVAVPFLQSRSNDVLREHFAEGFMPLDSLGAALQSLMVRGRRALEMSMPNWTGQGIPEYALPETVAWPLPVVGLGLIWLLWRPQTRLVGLAAGGIYSAVVAGSMLAVYPLGAGRTDVFAFPVGIMLFTAGIWCVTEALRYRSAVRLLAAAVATATALASPVPVDYRHRNDVTLVNHLGANSDPEDWIVLSFSAGYLAAFYGPWDARPVPYDTSTGFVATIARDRVLHLPLRLDWGRRSGHLAAAAEHRRVVSGFLAEHHPARIWFLAYHATTFDGTNWAPNVLGVLTDNGYSADRVLESTRGELYVAVASDRPLVPGATDW